MCPIQHTRVTRAHRWIKGTFGLSIQHASTLVSLVRSKENLDGSSLLGRRRILGKESVPGIAERLAGVSAGRSRLGQVPTCAGLHQHQGRSHESQTNNTGSPSPNTTTLKHSKGLLAMCPFVSWFQNRQTSVGSIY